VGVAESLHRSLGLTDDELDAIVARLGREPNRAELAMFSVMWSEHCSYKSSKLHLRGLPTGGPGVLVGPGEDAGVVDVGDGMACVFKMESHSHPSAIEPYQGAATGVGGIVRDVLSMGARPAALLDPLRFGSLDDHRNRWLFGGVVAGIGGYGNCIGVPTVGGEIRFAPAHSANPTVNVMCLGFARTDQLLSGRAGDDGDVLVLIGAGTGRDGIGGVSVLASATLEEDSHASRPSVQIGDPFMGKLLIEACLELRDGGLLAGLKDLGGAGLTCAVSESAAAAGLGADLDLDAVPTREAGMEAFEILISESQERMLAIVRPDRVQDVFAVCRKWGLASAPVGTLRTGQGLRVRSGDQAVADVPPPALADEGPAYDRPTTRPAWLEELRALDPARAPAPPSIEAAFLQVLGSPNVAGKRWAYEQYDQLVQGQTVGGPGGDAAVIRLEGSLKAVAVSADGNGRYGYLDPYLGAAHAVAEAARNVACAGARPMAITNCLNFGNPERPEVMWQFVQAVRGMGNACRALGTPVTGGNVSFYNESGGTSIWPTPVVGMIGVLEDHRLRVGPAFPQPDLVVYLLGRTASDLGGSEYADTVLGMVRGAPPALDLGAERLLIEALVDAASRDLLASAHDCSDGGVAIAAAESSIGGGIGLRIGIHGTGLSDHVALFSESASRALVSVWPGRERELETLAAERGVPIERVGITGGADLDFDGQFRVPVRDALIVYEGAIPSLMAASRAEAGLERID
jgi:phosphoribosylformylglycinamidine synthase II